MADDSYRTQAKPLIDRFGRQISYLRLSVTDRCDLRCTYCMSERMTFLPRADLLTLEELDQLTAAFIKRGVRKVRITGGEPLVRKDVTSLMDRIGCHLGKGLDELTLTTNGTLLSDHAQALYDTGVRRVNVSLDSIDPEQFSAITRRGDLAKVMRGIETALKIGLQIKINTVALKHQNAAELPAIIEWAHGLGMDLTLIEVMPMGQTGESRVDQYIPLTMIRDQLEQRWTLTDQPSQSLTAGPSKYVSIAETGGRLGFISPLTNNFCAGCNRIRVTCTGRIYMCLGQDAHVDLRPLIRDHSGDSDRLDRALDQALSAKPEKHDFEISRHSEAATLDRHMSVTGG